MALIKLNASELENVLSQISKLSSKASECANIVSSVRNNLDMEISVKRNIEECLDKINRDLTKQSEALKSYANVLNDVINEFVKADSSGSKVTASIFNWKNGAIAGSVFATGGILGGISSSGKHARQMNNWKTQQQLQKISSVGSMFGTSSCLMTSVPKGTDSTGESVKLPVEDVWDTMKTGKKAASLVDTFASIFNKGEVPDFIKDKTGSDFVKGIGYISDAEKAINAVIDSDVDALTELLGKYGIKKPLKEIVKTTVGGASAEVSLLTDLIYSDFESAIDVSNGIATEFTNVISNPDSNIMDYAKVIGELYRAPDKIITQGFINVVGDYADNIGGVLDFVGIVDAPEEGYIDFYKNAFADVKDMFNTFGAEDATSILVDSFKETISEQFNNTVDTMASIGKGISGFFKDLV